VGILEFSAKSWIVKMENKEERGGGGVEEVQLEDKAWEWDW